jgi:hypothetical protein
MVPFLKSCVHGFATSRLGRRAGIMLTDSIYWILRRIDPDMTMSEFYARTRIWIINSRLAHETLGPRIGGRTEPNMRGRMIDTPAAKLRGRRHFDKIAALGLTAEDTVVDFGCGTLRVGRHFVDYLKPHAYWGLDINDDILNLGHRMLGPGRVRDKCPNILKITGENLSAIRAAQPRFIVSTSVIIHVPPEDIENFCRQIAGLGNDRTAYYLTFSAMGRSARTSGTYWCYAPAELAAIFQRLLPGHEITTAFGGTKGRFGVEPIRAAELLAVPKAASERISLAA